MRRAVIDIGSNSVRLMVEGDKNKRVNTTQLAEGLAITGMLNSNAMRRTAEAIKGFYDEAMSAGAEIVYAFATEAVRSAANGQDFINMMKEEYNIEIDLLSPDREAKAGFIGSTKGGKVCVIDIGGGSTELIRGDNESITYMKSLPIGIVRLKDLCGQDVDKLTQYISEKIKEYGHIDPVDYAIIIGGTAGTIVAMLKGGYDRDEVHNYLLTRLEIHQVLHRLMTTKDFSTIQGLPPMRHKVIIGGIILLDHILEMLGLDDVVVSEEDNMEGYLKLLSLP